MSELRTACCIPGCRHTTAREHPEWICASHWKLVPPRAKRVWSRMRHRHRHGRPVSADRWGRIWDRLKAIATKRAAGDMDMREINELFGWNTE